MVLESILLATVKFVSVPSVVIFGWLLVVIVALIVLASILLATVRFVNVPRVVIFGWLLVVIVALIVAASILLETIRLLCAVNKPATVKAVCVPKVTILG